MFYPWLHLSMSFATQLTIDLINISIIGRTENPVDLAAVSLGNILVIMFVLSVVQGMSTALETLVSQAYGAQQPLICGEHLNRIRFINFLIFIPISLLLTQSESLLVFLGQDAAVSKVAATYIIYQLPGLFMFSLFEANRLFLNSMEMTKQASTVLIVALPFHIALCCYFVFAKNWGVLGLALAIDITYTLCFLVITGYCIKTKNETVRAAWVTPNEESLEGWTALLELGIPGVLVYFIDFGSFEAAAIFSGLIGIVELSTMGIILIVVQIVTCSAYGMQFTAAVFIGNSIGAQNVTKAKMYAKAAVVLVMSVEICMALLVYLSRNFLGRAFTSDPDVLEMYSRDIVFAAIFMIPDSLQLVMVGILKALGLQTPSFKRAIVA